MDIWDEQDWLDFQVHLWFEVCDFIAPEAWNQTVFQTCKAEDEAIFNVFVANNNSCLSSEQYL